MRAVRDASISWRHQVLIAQFLCFQIKPSRLRSTSMWRCHAIFLGRNCGMTSIVIRVRLGMEDSLHRQREVGPAGHIVDIRVGLAYAGLKRPRISGTICHQLESLELSPWKRSMRAFQLQFMGSSSWRHTAILKSLRLPYLATCSWIRTSSAAISISERARNVRGGCRRDLGAPSMLSTQPIHIRCVRRLLGQAPGLLHQHHDQDAGAAADPGCCDHPPCRDHSVTPLFRRPVAGSKLGCAARFSLCHGKLIVCRLTDIVMCATSPNFPSLCSIQRDVPPDS